MFGIPLAFRGQLAILGSSRSYSAIRGTNSAPSTAADAVSLTILLAAIVILFEFRRRRRASVVSFNLADVFVTLTLACCALGWFALARSSFQREVAAQATHETKMIPDSSKRVASPRLRRAPWSAIDGCRRSSGAGVDRCFRRCRSISSLCDHMRTLPYATTLSITGSIFGDDHYPYARLKQSANWIP